MSDDNDMTCTQRKGRGFEDGCQFVVGILFNRPKAPTARYLMYLMYLIF